MFPSYWLTCLFQHPLAKCSPPICYWSISAPLSKVCPSYWKGFQDQCYILMLDRKGWLNARADCKIEGGDLASPNNKGQQAFIYSLLQNSSKFNIQREICRICEAL
ncbi:hypothetical protein DPMN_114990 [Dreissena polymorpha]|uniref:C-type lectin domain-containing protein n=1 Tax=Dreissena polymorpha TaxID=45954 RepID=A0A9D4KL29_DREPO|nr:hypothetical protein DPMN_114990 [Dreissena polymorpha]